MAKNKIVASPTCWTTNKENVAKPVGQRSIWDLGGYFL